MSSICPKLWDMEMHPWVAEQLVENRRAERERAASGRRRSPRDNATKSIPVEPRPHRAPARLVGSLLIGAGRRLAGPDALAAALDASRVGRGRSPA